MRHCKGITSWCKLAAVFVVLACLVTMSAACSNQAKTGAPGAPITGTGRTSTVVASSGSPSMYGQPVTFTATVTATASGAGTPTGTVTFNDGSQFLGTGTLNSGTAIFSTSELLGGSHSITAVYGGDSNFRSSTSSSITQTVTPATTATAAASSGSATYSDAGQHVTLTATVTAAGATVNEGNVTFTVMDSHGNTVGAMAWGTVTGGSASAVYSLPGGSGAGTYTINAVYSGGEDFLASSSTGIASLTVSKAATAMLVPKPAYQRNIASPQGVTLTATVTTADGSVVNQGTVTFTISGGDGVGTVSVPVTGAVTRGIATAVYSLPANFSGAWGWPDQASDVITAHYSGGDNFQASDLQTNLNP